ncbi:hypothetical protein Tco_1428000 [Tanacetum coccineum]
MSDSDESGVTYTEVSSPFEDLSDIGSPRADDHEYLELPGMPEDPYAPPSPDYVPGPEHADDEIVAEDQPYAEDASPTAQSPDYVPESDPEADPEEDDDEDPEEDPVDYPANGGDDGDDEEGSSEDDEDDDMDIEADDDEEEEEEHLAPADECIALIPGYEVGESSSAAAARPAGGLRADYGFVATMDREIRRDPEREVGYGITDSWEEIVETLQGAPVSTDTELGQHMTAFETRVRQDTNEIYTRLDDEQKARLSREAWRRSMDASDLARGEVMSLHTSVLGQMSEIRELHAADRRRQAVILEMMKADQRRSTEMRELRTADHTR